MSTVILLALTGVGLGALYFLIASGLSLIFGLMRVLNFAHGAFLLVGAYASWWIGSQFTTGSTIPGWGLVPMLVFAVVAGAVIGALTELVLIRPLYSRGIDQVLVTVGLALVMGALVLGVFGSDPQVVPTPAWAQATTSIAGSLVPNTRFLVIGVAITVLALLIAFLKCTRYGLIIRAGVENRAMVTALGVDVRIAFTLVFAIGGAAAGLGGSLAGVYSGSVSPDLGATMLIFAFVVVVIGGLGSVVGSALAAVLVGLLQQFANYYAAPGVGDLSVVLLLASVLLVRPRGLMGRAA